MIRIMLNNLKSGLVVLGLFIMVGVLTLTFAFKAEVKTSTKAEEKSGKALVNPQWFTYNLDPTAANFSTAKLVAGNYTATGITSPTTRPCPSSSSFCSVYAETVSSQPNLSSGQPINAALTSYSNGDGDQTLIDEEN